MAQQRSVLVWLLACLLYTRVLCSGVTVQTKDGLIKGTTMGVRVNNGSVTVSVFYSVPYAKPPVGEYELFQKMNITENNN